MEIKIYDSLHDDAMNIRITVFVNEQGFIDLPDEIDMIAAHIVMYENENPVSACRVFKKEGTNSYLLGRLAVLKEYRGKGIGREMMKAAENYVASVNGESLMLHSQYHAREFYLRCGYTEEGEIEYEQGAPHIWMKKYREDF